MAYFSVSTIKSKMPNCEKDRSMLDKKYQTRHLFFISKWTYLCIYLFISIPILWQAVEKDS